MLRGAGVEVTDVTVVCPLDGGTVDNDPPEGREGKPEINEGGASCPEELSRSDREETK